MLDDSYLQELSTLDDLFRFWTQLSRDMMSRSRGASADLDTAVRARQQACRSRTPVRNHPSQAHGKYAVLLDARDALALTIGDICLPSHRLQSQPPTQLLPARCVRIANQGGACTMTWRWTRARRRHSLTQLSHTPPAHVVAAAPMSSPKRKHCAVDPAPVRKLKFSCTTATTLRSIQARFACTTFPQSIRSGQLKWTVPALRTFRKARWRSTESAC
ncbi:hypothetical protein B0H14DRAFT_3616859 [Mycena olivaceomarginata]|nr:hypothetical protein B0H14DRAFT_3616859 [Mycena olivaceomarginata]